MLRLLQHPMANNSGVSAPEARRGEGSSYRNPDSCVERVLDNSCDLPIMEVLLIWQGGKQEMRQQGRDKVKPRVKAPPLGVP